MPNFFSRTFLFFCCFFQLHLFAQKRLLNQLDTTLVEQNAYLAAYSREAFYAEGLAEERIDPENINTELAAVTIFHAINQWKVQRKKRTYKEHSKLDRIAYLYTQYYKRYRFRRRQDNYYRLKRTLGKVPRYLEMDFTYIDGYTDLPTIVDYQKGGYFFNEEIGASPTNLYYGEFSNEEDYVEVPIEQITYAQLAEDVLNRILKAKSGTILRSKAYELLAVRVAPMRKRKSKRYIPKAKVLFLVGAYRNKFINEEVTNEKVK